MSPFLLMPVKSKCCEIAQLNLITGMYIRKDNRIFLYYMPAYLFNCRIKNQRNIGNDQVILFYQILLYQTFALAIMRLIFKNPNFQTG